MIYGLLFRNFVGYIAPKDENLQRSFADDAPALRLRKLRGTLRQTRGEEPAAAVQPEPKQYTYRVKASYPHLDEGLHAGAALARRPTLGGNRTAR